MSLWSRIANVFRGDRVSREIEEELQSHMMEAVRQGRDPSEARKALGSALRHTENSRDIRMVAWLDSLRADAVFGWRQLMKKKIATTAAILSLALGIGACTAAFRLIDALLLRPLPVAEPQQLYALSRHAIGFDGKPASFDEFAYPAFALMRDATKDGATLLAVSIAERTDLTYQSDAEMEKAYLQYVSGTLFGEFGLRPTLGRLLTRDDDLTPRAHARAVLSYEYWKRRFGKDPGIVGRTFRMGDDLYEIEGVAPESFTGTEPGTVVDVFVPTMMHPGAAHDDWTWLRILAHVKPGVAIEPLRAQLHATSMAFERKRAEGFRGMSREFLAKFLAQTLVIERAPAGVSGLQQNYRPSLLTVAVLVVLVLLIACANVANLMTAQTAGRTREMALRVSIGAGRWRLVQLVLVESTMLAVFAGAGGGFFAWWSAPFVVSRINPPDNPARLLLPFDWRVFGFGVAITFAVVILFGLIPALRASAVKPARALKGGEDPHSRRRMMHALIAVQVAFCFLILFVTGMFTASFNRLSNRPIGFSADRILTLGTVAHQAQSRALWDGVATGLRTVPGVEAVAMAGAPLLGGNSWNGFISVNGAPPGPILGYFLNVSPGWVDVMKLRWIEGEDLRPGDTSSAIVNETFVRSFFPGVPPIGKVFAKGGSRYRVAAVVGDVPYRNMREPNLPVAYVPFAGSASGEETFVVRTSAENPMALAATLRRYVLKAHPGFRVSRVRTQAELVAVQTLRERLLAMLALFFAAVGVLLAGIGLYSVLDYSVSQRQREIGIRMAIGARAGDVARRVTLDIFVMVFAGAIAGLAMGLAAVPYIDSLLYRVRPGEPDILALPALTILAAAALAALPAVVRAVRIDPVQMLRAE